MNILVGEGFRPEIDSDGDIKFKYEGGTYYVINQEDSEYFQILFMSFWRIDGGAELGAAMLAATRANRETKVAKVWANSDLDRMNASAEIYCSDWSSLNGRVVMRCLRSITTAVERFRDDARALR